jgi:phosphatidate cytidylyltransferase
MASEIAKRTMSAVAIGAVSIAAVAAGGFYFWILTIVVTVLMLKEWYCINKKKGKLFYIGMIYLLVPMYFWIHESVTSPVTLSVNILCILTIVWSCDIFAYFGGRLLRGPKLAPNISPHKTWSGTIIGAAMSFIITRVFYVVSRTEVMCDTFIIVSIISSILGDLLESKVKRILGVKDTGSIIPGHGGIIDRLDSFLLTTYAFIVFNTLTIYRKYS